MEVSNNARKSASDAAGRLFRAYERYCRESSSDTLFNLLTAMHSLNDRLKRLVGRDFHSAQEYIALKAIRNLAHHQEELRSKVRIFPLPAYSDLAVMCIVRRDQIERAIETTPNRWRKETQAACEVAFHWYGPAVNINPCVFNFIVKVYEMLNEVDVRPDDEDIANFEASYLFEEEHGYSHFVDGHLVAQSTEVSNLLQSIIAEMPAPS